MIKVSEALSVEVSVTWQLDVKYPCSNLDYITISGATPAQQNYDLFSESLASPFIFTHNPFTIDLQASDDNSLCGDIFIYSASVDGIGILNDVVPPIGYDESIQ